VPVFMTLLTAAAGILAQHHGGHGQEAPRIGQVQFESTCNRAAEPLFLRGLAWLHSFEYDEAERDFGAAAAADPKCAIAHWGVAQSQYHPLWAPPSPAELAKGRAAMARAAGAGSARERAYIDALNVFYRGPDPREHKSRVFDYAAAMERLHHRYPEDREAAIFYSLALIAAGAIDDDAGYGRELAAATILNKVFAAAPDHPGVAHYLIHGYDYPALAHLALPAARRYADIAPASAHALHMPSHIFGRLGLWKEMIGSNRAALSAALAYAASRKMPGAWDERLHAMDYLMYGHLQLGEVRAAKGVLDDLLGIVRVDPPNFKVAYATTAIPARYALERRQWADAADLTLSDRTRALVPWPKFRWAEAHLHLARAIGSARLGRAEQARAEVVRLVEIERSLLTAPGEYDWKRQVSIQRQTAEAWALYSEGKPLPAEVMMRSAADLDDRSEKHPVTPGSIAPAREQLGELLLQLGRPRDALVAFQAALKQAPNRRFAMQGARRAAMLSKR
jgi:tetratricopeptide (TPR) repeat protein